MLKMSLGQFFFFVLNVCLCFNDYKFILTLLRKLMFVLSFITFFLTFAFFSKCKKPEVNGEVPGASKPEQTPQTKSSEKKGKF